MGPIELGNLRTKKIFLNSTRIAQKIFVFRFGFTLVYYAIHVH